MEQSKEEGVSWKDSRGLRPHNKPWQEDPWVSQGKLAPLPEEHICLLQTKRDYQAVTEWSIAVSLRSTERAENLLNFFVSHNRL